MSMSGVTLNDEVLNVFSDVKLKKTYRYVILKMSSDGSEIVVDKCCKREKCASYSEFMDMELVEEECLWAIYDFDHETKSKQKTSSLVLIGWCPDTATVAKKMVAAATTPTIQKKLHGFKVYVQATDKSEADPATVKDKLEKFN